MEITRATKGVFQQTLKSRRLEIEQRLAAFGLVRGPRRVFGDTPTISFEESHTRRLSRALSELGPILSSFGLYLAARADLLPARDCLELGMIPDRGAVTPAEVVRHLVREDLNRFPEEGFTTFDEKPFESRLLFQAHRASLTDGRQIIIKLIHPEIEEQCFSDLDLLPLLRGAFIHCGISDTAIKSAELDFRHSFEHKINFLNAAKAFEQLSQDAEEHDVLIAARVYQHLSSSRILTLEQLNGITLDHVLSRSRGDEESSRLLARLGFERRELARVLCEIWLRQALLCRYFPVEPHPTNLLVLAGKKLAFTDGPFASISPGPQANLLEYLTATANENSEQACACLLKELRRTETSTNDDEVRQRFRQAMPFRDGGWSLSSDCQSLAELLFVHWRCANECGFQPLGHLPAFYRGLFAIANVARRVTPQIDPLREGLRDLRLLGGVTQFRDMLSPSVFADQLDKYVAMMVELPRSIDEILNHAAEPQIRTGSRQRDSVDRRKDKNFPALVIIMLLVMAAFAWLSRYLPASTTVSIWTDRMSAIVFVMVSAFLLQAATSRGER